MKDGPIVFFDGVCGLCNGFVDFLLRADRRHILRFASLQGNAARTHLQNAPVEAGPLESVVLWEREHFYLRSDAVLRIFLHLGGLWCLAALAYLIPRSWRDALYRLVARHRYHWFGQRTSCRRPTEAERDRFID